MAEGKVSVDGITYELPKPFFVIATQNPVEQYGTFPLPESQLDRFSMRLSLGYPDKETEVSILRGENPLENVARLSPMVKPHEILATMQQISRFYVSPEVARFVVEIVSELATIRMCFWVFPQGVPSIWLAVQRRWLTAGEGTL